LRSGWLLLFVLAANCLAAPADLQQFIDGRLAAGKKKIVIPPGRYRAAPVHGSHLTFKNLTNIWIAADGVEMDCAETSKAVSFQNCRNVRLTGLAVDYDPLPFTEGRITAMAPDKSWLEFQVIDGYPENEFDGRIEIFDPATGELARETRGWDPNIISLGNHRYRLSKPKGYRFDANWDYEKVGDILVANQRSPHGGADHAIVAQHCDGLTLEDVTLYASPMFGFLEVDCNGSIYRRCKIDRRPLENDPVHRGLKRYRSLNADAFHSIGAERGPSIISCTAKFQGDDCVNIHGTYYMVLGSEGNQLRIAAISELAIAPGDEVEFMPYSGQRPADAKAEKIETDVALKSPEREFITKMPLDESIRRRFLDPKAHFYKITFNRAVPLPMGSGICSSKRVGNGCVVRDCDFGYNRSRGIIIKAPHATVTGNKIAHTWMQAILASPEFFWWLEAACPDHLVISGNIITGCRGNAIDVTAPGGDDKPLPAGALHDVVIHDNRIIDSMWPNIRVTSAAGVMLKNNKLTPSNDVSYSPPLSVRWNWTTNRPAVVVIEHCEP
jgi:hypothetical protein